MAKKNRATFAKREREMARREKQEAKRARRQDGVGADAPPETSPWPSTFPPGEAAAFPAPEPAVTPEPEQA